MTAPEQAAWPEGVIARYLTLGGATVDLTVRYTLPPEPEPFATLATCTGCPASEEFSHWATSYSHFGGAFKEERDVAQANEQARAWAQTHAESCRALPRPGGESR